MNPSAPGWINKFGHLANQGNAGYPNFESLYLDLKRNGFVYGVHLAIPPFIEAEHVMSEDEIAKINLITALYFTYSMDQGETDFPHFVKTVFDYYRSLDVGRISFLNKILSGSNTGNQLEKLVDSRIYLGGNAFSRAFGNSLTNSLLYVDVLIFMAYLRGESDLMAHAQQLEYITINIAYRTLSSKLSNPMDAKFIQLLDSSLTYLSLENNKIDGFYMDLLDQNFTAYEKDYFLDMACLTLWEDHFMAQAGSNYILDLGKALGKAAEEVESELANVSRFFELNKDRIAYLNDKNLAVQFYEGMSKSVSKLILRNSKRLKKELAQSRELVSLLSKSTVRELSPKEKKKVQSQLMDIFKTIPSLAIFLLPGGAVLLPIFIKLIPKLLPSSFDDNRVEKN